MVRRLWAAAGGRWRHTAICHIGDPGSALSTLPSNSISMVGTGLKDGHWLIPWDLPYNLGIFDIR